MNATVSDHGAATPPEKWTLRQQMDAQAGAQALVAQIGIAGVWFACL